jgi:lambda family phage tail tape measure protein
MATIDNYTINISVKGDQDLKTVTASVNNLGKTVDTVSSNTMKNFNTAMTEGSNHSKEFSEKIVGLKENAERLAVAIVGVGFAEYIRKIGESAAETKDLSEAFGLQIQTVLELQAGFQRAGRDANAMTAIMSNISIKAIEAAEGNLQAQASFDQLGVSMKDLKSLSMDEVILKIAKTMEASKGSAETLAAAIDIGGKKMKGMPAGDLVEGLERARGKFTEAEAGVIEFDTAMKNMAKSIQDISREFMILVTPVVKFFNEMTEGSNRAKLAAEILAGAMAVFAGGVLLSGIRTLVSFVTALGPAAVTASAGVATLAASTTVLGTSLARFGPLITSSIAALGLLYSGDLNKGEDEQLKQIQKLGDAIATLPKAQQEAYFKMSAAEQKRIADAVKNGQAIKDAMAGLSPGSTGTTGSKNESVLPASKKEYDLQAAGNTALQSQYIIQKLITDQTEQRLKLQADLIGLGEIEKTQKLASFDAQQKKQQDILRLTEEIRKIEVQAANEPEGQKKYAGQLSIMREQLKVVTNQKDKTAELTTQLKMAELSQQKVLFGRQLEYKSVDEMSKLQNEINSLSLTSDQQKIQNIQQIIQAEATAEIRRREALLGNGQNLGLLEQIDILHQVEKAYDPIIAKQQELIDASRQFATGWNTAFNQFVSDSTNAGKRGEQTFSVVTNNMNSSIDNFVTSGKFSFEDFTRSIIQDLIKIELKAQASQLIRGLFGGGGVLGFLGDIFRADGGPVMGNKPYIVGERGPELFVPQASGSIIPNGTPLSGSSGSSSTTNITNNYNVNAIDQRSVAQFFAENRKTMLGSVQLAQKELPYSNR